MQNMQYIKNEVKDFAWNVFIIFKDILLSFNLYFHKFL